jgi:pSer/pThr/pTyr-binding forkhead associated (FHA) protein
MLGIVNRKCKEGHYQDPSWKTCPICLSPVCGWLIGIGGPLDNKVFTIHEGRNKIGFGTDCEVRIPNDTLSEYHATITYNGENYTLNDTNSVNGTFVNDKQVINQLVTDGDIVRLGNISFKLKCLW